MTGLPWYATTYVPVPAAELVAQAVGKHRVVTMLGPGGAGKTRLVVEVLPRIGPGYERCMFVDVPAAPSAGDVAILVAESMGARVRQSDPLDAIEAALGDSPTLLVLDSCELYLAACAELVHALVSRIRTLDVLCTSRQPLGLDGEAHIRLGPLQDHAHTLFVDRALLADPTFDQDATELIRRVCDATDGLPLAIELAAAQLGHMPMAHIANGVIGRVHLLEREASTGAGRHRSMRACVEWSLGLLTDDERRELQALAVFEGSFDTPAARLVLASDDPTAARVIARFVARSLLVPDGPHSDRFRLLDVVREVVAAERHEFAEFDDLSARHLSWAVEVCRAAAPELEGAGLEATVRSMLQADADLTAAFHRAVDRGDLEHAEVMFGSLALHWITSGRFNQAQEWFEACRAIANGRPLGCRSNWTAALLAVYSGSGAEATELATLALAQAREVDDRSIEARSLDVLGFAALTSDPAAAEALLIDAAACADSAGDSWCHADAAQIAGYAALARGRPDLARAHLLRARPIAERLGHAQLLAWDRAGLALVDASSGHFRRAAAGLVEALRHADATGDPNITASVTAFQCRVGTQLDEAPAWIERADDLFHRCRRLGAGQGAAELVVAQVELFVAVGEPHTANDLWALSAGPLGHVAPVIHRRLTHAGAAAALTLGDPGEARARLKSAAGRSAPIDSLTETWLAVVALFAEDTAAARRHLRRATDDGALPTAQIELHDLAVTWAALIAADGDDVRAADVLDAAGGPLIGDATAPSMIARLLSSRLPHAPVPEHPVHADPRQALTIARSRGRRSSARFGWSSLTPTERKVAALAAQGLTNRAIAERLHSSAGTVKSHLEHIYAKTGTANRTELAADRDRLDPGHP